jgi:trigger factor
MGKEVWIMQVSIEILDGLQRRLTVELPAARIDEEVHKRLRKMSGRVRLRGFRPGKVPVKVVKGRFGKSVRDEVTNEVIRDSYIEALKQEQLKPAGGPVIDVSPVAEGEDLKYLATFEVFPELELASLESFEIRRPVAEITGQDIDNMLERLRKQRVTWSPVDRAAVEGDRVTMDFTGSMNGEEFEGGSGTDAAVVLGSRELVPGFEAGLEGMAPGERKIIKVTFPGDYHSGTLAGREADFTVSMKEVAEPQLPEVDEQFTQAFGVKEGGVETLRDELKRNMEGQLRRGIRAQMKQQVMQQLLTAHELVLPKALVDNELRNLAEQAGMLKKDESEPAEIGEEVRARFGDQARDRVKLGLIVQELVKTAGIEVDQRRVDAHIDMLASTYEQPDQLRGFYRTNSQAMETVRGTVMEEQVVDWVLERARVSEVPNSFEAALSPDLAGSSDLDQGDNQ